MALTTGWAAQTAATEAVTEPSKGSIDIVAVPTASTPSDERVRDVDLLRQLSQASGGRICGAGPAHWHYTTLGLVQYGGLIAQLHAVAFLSRSNAWSV